MTTPGDLMRGILRVILRDHQRLLDDSRKMMDILAMGAESPWIRCEDRMPEGSATVLTAHAIGGVTISWWDPDHEVWRTVDAVSKTRKSAVTHWMPLPDPPEVNDG